MMKSSRLIHPLTVMYQQTIYIPLRKVILIISSDQDFFTLARDLPWWFHINVNNDETKSDLTKIQPHSLAVTTLMAANCGWLFSNLLGKPMMIAGQFVFSWILWSEKMQVRGQFSWKQMHPRVGNGYSPVQWTLPLKDCLLCQEWNPLFISAARIQACQ